MSTGMLEPNTPRMISAKIRPGMDSITSTRRVKKMSTQPPTTALMTRRCTAPLQVGPHTLPAGTLARVTIWSLHRDARWFADPDAFRPERFLPDAPPPRNAAAVPRVSAAAIIREVRHESPRGAAHVLLAPPFIATREQLQTIATRLGESIEAALAQVL
jgi:hypothetical protein